VIFAGEMRCGEDGGSVALLSWCLYVARGAYYELLPS